LRAYSLEKEEIKYFSEKSEEATKNGLMAL